MGGLRSSLRLREMAARKNPSPEATPTPDRSSSSSSASSGLPSHKKRRVIRHVGRTRRMTRNEEALYFKQVKESGGFDVPRLPGVLFFGMIFPVSCGWRVKKLAKFAIRRNNSKKGTDLQLVRVVKANLDNTYVLDYYMTFEAKDTQGHVQTYEALVRRVRHLHKIYLLKFRVQRGSTEGNPSA